MYISMFITIKRKNQLLWKTCFQSLPRRQVSSPFWQPGCLHPSHFGKSGQSDHQDHHGYHDYHIYHDYYAQDLNQDKLKILCWLTVKIRITSICGKYLRAQQASMISSSMIQYSSRVGKKWEPRNPVPGPFSAKIWKVNENLESEQEFWKLFKKFGKLSGKLRN